MDHEEMMPKASDNSQSGPHPTVPPGPVARRPITAEPHAAAVPRPLTRFIGREREIAAVACQLEQGVRLLTLTGPGGVGKTRLAIEVANRVAAALDQVWFVPLATVREPTLVAPTIMRALGRAQTGGRRLPAEELRMMLGDRTALLVLDNFEQVVDAGPLVVDLLMACPSLTVLVTSRAPLRVSGEHLHAVSPLTLPDASDRIEQSEAFRLFADRAMAVVPSFELTPDNAETIGEMCRRLDGLPLAIELAAARLTLFSPAELLRRMDARLALLRDGAVDQPARLRSLRESIAWSHDLLSASEQALFARLAVFVGGWTLDAAEDVAGEGDAGVQEDLATLILRNLVWRTVQPDGTSRYGMLETLREFAGEQLASRGEDTSTRDRHARWFLALARDTRAESSTLNQILAIGPLEQEHANIRAALRWLDATGQAEALADLVNALEHHWEWNKHEVEGLGWYQRVLGIKDLSPGVRLELLGGAAFLAHKIASPLAEGLVEEFALQAEARGTLRQRANACFLVGMHAEDTGDFARAEACLPVARDYADRVGDTWTSLECSYHLGVVALGRGALDRAMEIFDGARSASMGIDNPLIPAWCLVHQALIWCERGKPERAAALLRQHPDMNRVAFRQHEPILRAVAGVVACQLGDYRRAARLWGAAAHDVPMRHPEKEITERSAVIARRALGEAEFTREWDAGNRMPPSEVQVEIVQLLAGHERPTVDGPVTKRHDLSPRELDVLRLIAAGKTDRHIAEALYISQRTAEWHVRNVLGKLGAANRAEAAVLAARDGLL